MSLKTTKILRTSSLSRKKLVLVKEKECIFSEELFYNSIRIAELFYNKKKMWNRTAGKYQVFAVPGPLPPHCAGPPASAYKYEDGLDPSNRGCEFSSIRKSWWNLYLYSPFFPPFFAWHPMPSAWVSISVSDDRCISSGYVFLWPAVCTAYRLSKYFFSCGINLLDE